MSFHPIAGLFSPGEGPGLSEEAGDACAFEDHGRWRTTRCRSADVTSAVEGFSLCGEPYLCTPHAKEWAQTPGVQTGCQAIYPLNQHGGPPIDLAGSRS
ncbi:hypothetical protein [Frankia sp. CcI49]|uniref:hypothetical protein n=1 Tax=Frankia sp. CcI49 TaxID=1745382 RepID=UPI001054F374|nr:hypothetical protein [Frankia sp. CcI49]